MPEKLTVDQSFQKFISRLNPTKKQVESIKIHRDTIDRTLANDQRITLYPCGQPSFLTGSYARNTLIRPIQDIDLYVRVHYTKHAKDKAPRAVLRLMASALRKRYGDRTKINVDAPCVVVRFFGFMFEIVPAVVYDDDPELFGIPAPGSREWMYCYPNVPGRWLSSSNQANSRMFIPMIKMLKQWNVQNNKRLNSFHIELLTEKVFGEISDVHSYPQAIYDWMYCVRNWIHQSDYPFMQEPGKRAVYVDGYLYEKPFLLRVVRKALDTGLKRAERAWNLYLKGRPEGAKRVWRLMFGDMFPVPKPAYVAPPPPVPVEKAPLTLKNALLGLSAPVPPQRNSLLDILSNPIPEKPEPTGTDITRNALLGLLYPRDPFEC